MITDQVFGFNMQKSGLMDTMGDLIVDAVGALFAALSGYIFLRGNNAGFMARLIRQLITLNKHLYRKSMDWLNK